MAVEPGGDEIVLGEDWDFPDVETTDRRHRRHRRELTTRNRNEAMEVENSSVRISNAIPSAHNDSAFGEYYGGDSAHDLVTKDSWVEGEENVKSFSSARQSEGI